MREEHIHGTCADDSIVSGSCTAPCRHRGRNHQVAVSAGFITANDAIIKSIGFGLAIGILVDAFPLRMTLVPAIMSAGQPRMVVASLARPGDA